MVGCEKYSKRKLFGMMELKNGKYDVYKWETYSEVRERVENLGKGLKDILENKLNIKAKECPIGIFSINRPEWCIIELATCSVSAIVVGFYDSYTQETVGYVVNEAELPIVGASVIRARDMLEYSTEMASLKIIVIMDRINDEEYKELKSKADKKGLELLTIKEVEERGSSKDSCG